MNRALQVARRHTGAHDSGSRQIANGLYGEFEVVDRLRDEELVEGHDGTVVVLDVRREMIAVYDCAVMVILEVCVRDRVVMTVRPVGLVHVLDRGQRERRQTRDKTQRDHAKCRHDFGMLWDRVVVRN